MTAWLMELERPKSSALKMSRRPGSGRAIVWRHRAGGETQPGAQNQPHFLPRAEAGRFRPKDVEIPGFELLQQPPVNRAHQFGGDHGPAVRGWEGRSRPPVEFPRAAGHTGREFMKAR